jgi:hypothetical protein
MINIASIYDELSKDVVSVSQNGRLTIDSFNRISKRAELELLNWLTGDVEGLKLPAPFNTQKNKDWLLPFIVPSIGIIKNGTYPVPDNYYQHENMFYITANIEDCDEETLKRIRKPIELLDGSRFSLREDTWVDELSTDNKPIVKILSDDKGKKYFYFSPEDLGNVQLEYIRYPKYGVLAKAIDPVYRNEVTDSANSIHYEFDEWARPYLIALMASYFGLKNREQALQQQNEIVKNSRP